MPTEKLYWQDPFTRTFEASQATVGKLGDKASIVLERTLFYPEAGGQLADHGTIKVGGRELAVTDVQIDDAGEIHHLVDGVLPSEMELAGPVAGSIDLARRRDHMAQHTAQHMLSRALLDAARADTVSARLGSTSCTIDVSLSDVPDAALARAEDLVNAAIMDDLVVRSLFPTTEELSQMKLRRAPKVTEGIRIIDVEGFNQTPCGGTHCTRTGQIGSVVVAGTERYKGKLRVLFHAGERARRDSRAKLAVLAGLAQELTCGPLDVPVAVAKLRSDLKARLDALSAARGELVDLVAQSVLAAHPPHPSGTTPLAIVREKDDVGTLRSLAGRLASRPDVVAFCAAAETAGADLSIVVQRGASASFDCGAWLKEAAAKHGGRGGGRPERAEGRLPASCSLAEVVAALSQQ